MSDDEPLKFSTSPGPPHRDARPIFKDEFYLATTDDADITEYEKLQPPDGMSPVHRRALTAESIPLTIIDDESARRVWQFSLTELMWLTTFLCIGFAAIHYLPAKGVAFVCGLLALVGMGLLTRYPPERRHIRGAAIGLLVLNVVAAFVAFIVHVYNLGR